MNRVLHPVFLLVLAVGCSSPMPKRPRDPDLTRFADSARVSFQHGSYEQAVQLYRRALDRARASDDSLEIGNNAYNLAVALLAVGRPAESAPYLVEARTELERQGKSAVDIALLEVSAARMGGRLDEAWQKMADVDAQLQKGASRDQRLQAVLLNAQLALDRGDVSAAQAVLAGMPKDLAKVRDPLLRARRAGLAGRLAMQGGQFPEAVTQYDEEAAFYRQAMRQREMARALDRAGRACLEMGDSRAAADRWYRAARSLVAQGEDKEALEVIQTALSAAEKTGEESVLRQMAALFEDIRSRAGAPAEKKPPAQSSKPVE